MAMDTGRRATASTSSRQYISICIYNSNKQISPSKVLTPVERAEGKEHPSANPERSLFTIPLGHYLVTSGHPTSCARTLLSHNRRSSFPFTCFYDLCQLTYFGQSRCKENPLNTGRLFIAITDPLHIFITRYIYNCSSLCPI